MRNVRDYDVGYGKPPVKHRFQKGVCPNPAGRGKRPSRKIGQVTRSIMDEKLVVSSLGRKSHLSRLRVLMRACVQSAAKGNVASAALLLKIRDFIVNQPSDKPMIIKVIGGLPDDDDLDAMQESPAHPDP